MAKKYDIEESNAVALAVEVKSFVDEQLSLLPDGATADRCRRAIKQHIQASPDEVAFVSEVTTDLKARFDAATKRGVNAGRAAEILADMLADKRPRLKPAEQPEPVGQG